MADCVVTVVGIGADGWAGLAPASRERLRSADIIAGSTRQLALLDGLVEVTAARQPWPTPLLPALPAFFEANRERRVVVVASGDPMQFGIGSHVVRLLGAAAVEVLPGVSSVSLACARLGWSLEDVEVVSAVGRPLAAVELATQPGRRVLVLISEPDAASTIARMLRDRGFGSSSLTVLERLGAEDEQITHGIATTWQRAEHDRLAIVAIDCRADPDALVLPRVPGLPDDAFEHDGQITKREVRAMTLAALAPVPGQLLWDIGAGSGSVAIEWMRCHPACRAIAVEPRADRRERIARNALALGVAALEIVEGSAPQVLADLPAPDAVFVGGAVSVAGVLDACLDALSPGGRLVANAVTVESEAVLADAHARFGGTLTRLAVQHAEPVGRFSGWRAAMPVTQWALRKR